MQYGNGDNKHLIMGFYDYSDTFHEQQKKLSSTTSNCQTGEKVKRLIMLVMGSIFCIDWGLFLLSMGKAILDLV